MVGKVKFEARIRELVETLPDLAVLVEPMRHRQTKGAATDMFNLQPPRHISTLPDCYRIGASRRTSKWAKRRHRTGSLKLANSAKIAHVSECEGKSQKLTSRARLIKAIHDGVVNSLPEILANFRGPVSIGAEYHGNLPQVDLSNHQQPHGGCVGGHEIPLLLYCIDLSDIFPAVPQFHVGRGACQPTRRVGHQQTSLVP